MFVFIPGSISPLRFGPGETDLPDDSISPVKYIFRNHAKFTPNLEIIVLGGEKNKLNSEKYVTNCTIFNINLLIDFRK